METDDMNATMETRFNADAHAVYTLSQLGFVEIIGRSWPDTKIMRFRFTPKGILALHYDAIFDE